MSPKISNLQIEKYIESANCKFENCHKCCRSASLTSFVSPKFADLRFEPICGRPPLIKWHYVLHKLCFLYKNHVFRQFRKHQNLLIYLKHSKFSSTLLTWTHISFTSLEKGESSTFHLFFHVCQEKVNVRKNGRKSVAFYTYSFSMLYLLMWAVRN